MEISKKVKITKEIRILHGFMNGKENVNSRYHVRKSINGVSYLTDLKSGERERERAQTHFSLLSKDNCF